MALIPFAEKLLIPAGTSDPPIDARIGILHVDAGNAESLYRWFNGPSGGIESHGFVKKSGELEQYRDTGRQADANYLANDFATSWETQGFGPGLWTPEQLETIKEIILWSREADGIPLRVATSWNDPQGGWGYHTMFPQWSNVRGKTCPGPDRIKQFHEVLLPWMTGYDRKPAKKRPTVNITAALEASTRAERKAALKKVAENGSGEARQAALAWLSALRAIQKAEKLATAARGDLKDEEVRR